MFEYLASPYSQYREKHRDAIISILTKVTSQLMLENRVIYAPIIHGYVIATREDLPHNFDFWMLQSIEILNCASKLLVLKLPEWEMSKGVRLEIMHAKQNKIGVEYLNLEQFGFSKDGLLWLNKGNES